MKISETVVRRMRWTLFALALPLSGFLSYMGLLGMAFGGSVDALPLLLVLPAHLLALFSFRAAAYSLFSLLAIHLLLPFRFGIHHLTLEDLVPARLDSSFWLLVVMVGIAAFALPRGTSSKSFRNRQARKLS